MKSLHHFLVGILLAITLLFAFAAPPAFATTGISTIFTDKTGPNIFPLCDADATTGYTNSTTAYTDVTLASCAITPTKNDPTTAANPAGADLLFVTFSVDAIKASAGTGTCALFVNGAVLAFSARTLGGVVNGVMSWQGYVANTTVGAQTVKLQCKSSDTNAIFVSFAHLTVTDYSRATLNTLH